MTAKLCRGVKKKTSQESHDDYKLLIMGFVVCPVYLLFALLCSLSPSVLVD